MTLVLPLDPEAHRLAEADRIYRVLVAQGYLSPPTNPIDGINYRGQVLSVLLSTHSVTPISPMKSRRRNASPLPPLVSWTRNSSLANC